MTTPFERAGGEPRLRAVIETFYDRVLSDVMIGFLFWGTDRQRLIDKETELACRALGSTDIEYTGRPIREAHARHPILGGHFDRRLQLLREAMQAHGLPEDVQAAWVEHTRALRPLVTADAGAGCDHQRAAERVRALTGEEL